MKDMSVGDLDRASHFSAYDPTLPTLADLRLFVATVLGYSAPPAIALVTGCGEAYCCCHRV